MRFYLTPYHLKKPKIKTTRRSRLSAKNASIAAQNNPKNKQGSTQANGLAKPAASTNALAPYILYTDGSYFYEFEKAGIGGYLLSPNKKTVFEFSKVLNNPSVYEKHEIMALEAGLLEAARHHVRHLKCYTDDQKLAEILNIRNPTQRSGYIQSNPYLEHVNVLLRRFESIQFEYLPRTKNKRADKLSRKKLLEEISHLTRVIDNAFSVKNFYCTQQYSMRDSDKFSELKSTIQEHIAFHVKEDLKLSKPKADSNIEPSSSLKRYRLEIYRGIKHTSSYKSQRITSVLLKPDWLNDAVKQMALHLKKEALRRQELGQENLNLVVALKERQKLLDNFLRGRTVLQADNQKSVEAFRRASLLYDKIVLHSDDTWLKSIFKDNAPPVSPFAGAKEYRPLKARRELDYLPLPDEDYQFGYGHVAHKM